MKRSNIFISFENFVEVEVWLVYFGHSIVSIWVMSYNWLQSARVDAEGLPHYSYIFVLAFVFRDNHVRW